MIFFKYNRCLKQIEIGVEVFAVIQRSSPVRKADVALLWMKLGILLDLSILS